MEVNSENLSPANSNPQQIPNQFTPSQIEATRTRILSLYKTNLLPQFPTHPRSFLLQALRNQYFNSPSESYPTVQIEIKRSNSSIEKEKRQNVIETHLPQGELASQGSKENKKRMDRDEVSMKVRKRQVSGLDTPINKLINIELSSGSEDAGFLEKESNRGNRG